MSELAIPEHVVTPWASQPIAWRHHDRKERHEALQAQVNAGYEFLVREVLVHSPEVFSHRALTLEEALRTLTRADEEFGYIADTGIVPAPTEWHVFTDDDNVVRVLARVAIVEGKEHRRGYRAELSPDQLAIRTEHDARVNKYRTLQKTSRRLDDVQGLDQYMIGQFRESGLCARLTPEPTDCLIDTEPLFWLRLSA